MARVEDLQGPTISSITDLSDPLIKTQIIIKYSLNLSIILLSVTQFRKIQIKLPSHTFIPLTLPFNKRPSATQHINSKSTDRAYCKDDTNTCSLGSLALTSVAPREASSFSRYLSSCSRNFGLGASWHFVMPDFALITTRCLSLVTWTAVPVEPWVTDAWAGHVSRSPEYVSWCGCNSVHSIHVLA